MNDAIAEKLQTNEPIVENHEVQVQQPDDQPLPPIAVIQGHALTELPADLYIPPDALEILLEAFEGPLDLLIYLIKREKLDILDIPIASITRQYVDYIELMQNLRLELAAEYLVMAAMLAEIKSRMLLPRPVSEEGDEEDPRAELIRHLQEYERFKTAAQDIDTLPRRGRDWFSSSAEPPDLKISRPLPEVELRELILAFKEVMKRTAMTQRHQIAREPLSVRERMSEILTKVKPDEFTEFMDLFDINEGRQGIVVTFIAVLELLKQGIVNVVQNQSYSLIHLKAVTE